MFTECGRAALARRGRLLSLMAGCAIAAVLLLSSPPLGGSPPPLHPGTSTAGASFQPPTASPATAREAAGPAVAPSAEAPISYPPPLLPWRTFHTAPTAGRATSPRPFPPAPSAATDQASYLLANRSLVPGTPHPWNLAVPYAMSYNARNASVLVGGTLSGTVGEYAPETGALLGGEQLGGYLSSTSPFEYQITALTYDPVSGLAFAATGAGTDVYAWYPANGTYLLPYFLPTIGLIDALAYDSGTGLLYAADATNNVVWALNVAAGWSVQAKLAVGSTPDALLLDPATSLLYVANFASGNLSVISLSSVTVSGSVGVGPQPVALALDPVNDTVWVADQIPSEVVVLNASSLVHLATLPLPAGSNGTSALVYDSGLGAMVVLDAPSGELTLFNASRHAALAPVRLGGAPFRGVYDPVHHQLEIGDGARNLLEVLNDSATQPAHTYLLGTAPSASFVDDTAHRLYIADAATDQVVVFNSTTGAYRQTIAVGGSPVALVDNPSTGVLAAVELQDNVTFIVSATSGVLASWSPRNGTTFVGGAAGGGVFLFQGGNARFGTTDFFFGPPLLFAVNALSYRELRCMNVFGTYAIAYDSANGHFYATTFGNYLLVIPSSGFTSYSTVTTPFAAGIAIAYDNATGVFWISSFGNFTSGNMTEYAPATSSFGASVVVGGWTTSISFDWATGELFAADDDQYVVYGVTGAPFPVVTAQWAVGEMPGGISVSSEDGLLFVPNLESGTVSVIVIDPRPPAPLRATLSVSAPAVRLNQNVTLTVVASFPSWNDSYVYSGLPAGCTSANASTLQCASGTAGPYSVNVTVSNPYGRSATAGALYAVAPAISILRFTATPSAIDQSTVTRVVVNATGGLPPLTVSYPQRPANCFPGSSTNWTCTPNTAGNVTIEASVTDSIGDSASANITLVVNVLPRILGVTVSPHLPVLGHPISIAATFTGGTAPYTLHYIGLPSGCQSADVANLTCTPNATGSYTVEVRLTDAVGVNASESVSLTVSSHTVNSPSSAGGLSSTDLAILLVVIGAAAAGAGLMLYGRRARRSGGGATQSPLRPARPAAPSRGAPTRAAEGGVPAPPSGAAEAPPETPVEVAPLPPPLPPREPVLRPIPEPGGSGPSERPGAVGGGSRAPITCAYCGMVNEPWLTTCRNCQRALVSRDG